MKNCLLYLFLLCCACQSESDAPIGVQANLPTSLLIFKAEQQLEIWQNGQIETHNFQSKLPLPIGRYEWQDEKIWNENDTFLLTTLLTTTTTFDTFNGVAFIFPNDARSAENFLPCLRCPHTTAASYSQLWLYLQPYKKSFRSEEQN